MPKPIKKLAFVVNKTKPGAMELAESLQLLAEEMQVATTLSGDYPVPTGYLAGQDACCVIGGDGTILGVVPEAVAHSVPVFGVNLGKLGFLATFSQAEAVSKFHAVLEGEHTVDRLALLRCETADGSQYLALNDAVIKHPIVSAIVDVEVFHNEDLVAQYACDGIIFSTPTGSTAYNLSAGGPLLHPQLDAIAMTPICPHTLSSRSMIFPANAVLKVFCRRARNRPVITLDGRVQCQQPNLFPIKLTLAEERFPIIRARRYQHFDLLRNKLKW